MQIQEIRNALNALNVQLADKPDVLAKCQDNLEALRIGIGQVGLRFNFYWLTFEKTISSGGACIEARGEQEAKEWAENLTRKKVTEARILPYPASPVLWQFEHPIYGQTPCFCYQPGFCQDHRACPNDPSCTS